MEPGHLSGAQRPRAGRAGHLQVGRDSAADEPGYLCGPQRYVTSLAFNYGLLWLVYGLLWGIVTCYFRLFGAPGNNGSKFSNDER